MTHFEQLKIMDYSNILKSPIITNINMMYIDILRNPDKPLPKKYKHTFSEMFASEKVYRDLYNEGGSFTKSMNYAIYRIQEGCRRA